MGLAGTVIAVEVFALLIIQGLTLWHIIRWTHLSEKNTELEQAIRRLAKLEEQQVGLQKETNRLLKKIVFEEGGNEKE